MHYSLRLQPEVLLEIQTAFDWYEQQKEDLGYELLEKSKPAIKNSSKIPNISLFLITYIGALRLIDFPYLLIYEIEGDQIIINSFRRIKRKPL